MDDLKNKKIDNNSSRVEFETILHQITLENILAGSLTLGSEIPLKDYIAFAKDKYPQYKSQKLEHFRDIGKLVVKKGNKFYVTTNELELNTCLTLYFYELIKKCVGKRYLEQRLLAAINNEIEELDESSNVKSVNTEQAEPDFLHFAVTEFFEVWKYPAFEDFDYGDTNIKEFTEILMRLTNGYTESEPINTEIEIKETRWHILQRNLKKILKGILCGEIKNNDNITAYLAENLPESADKYDILYIELSGLLSIVNRVAFIKCDFNLDKYLLCRLLFHCISSYFHNQNVGDNFSLKVCEIYKFYRTPSGIILPEDVI